MFSYIKNFLDFIDILNKPYIKDIITLLVFIPIMFSKITTLYGLGVAIIISIIASLIIITLFYEIAYIKLKMSHKKLNQKLSEAEIKTNNTITLQDNATKNEKALITHTALETTKTKVMNKILDNPNTLEPIDISFLNFYAPEFAETIKQHYTLDDNATAKINDIFKHFNTYKPNVNALLEKILNNIVNKNTTAPVISLQTINFLNSITDEELEIIKKQFKYIIYDSILKNSSNINDQLAFFRKEKIFNPILYEMFIPNIWQEPKNEIEKTIKFDIPENTKFINLKFNDLNFSITFLNKTYQNISKYKYNSQILVSLNQTGLELYHLLKNEIKDIDIEYLKKAIIYNIKNNSKYIVNGQEITAEVDVQFIENNTTTQ
jgi:hypothetical protein